jgi:inosose dehydratase
MSDNPVGFQTITWGFGHEDLRRAWHDISEMGFRYFEVLNVSSLVDDFERRTLQLGPVGVPQRLTDTEYLSWVSLLTEGKRSHGLQITSIYTDAEYVNPNLWDLELAQFRAMAVILKGLGAQHLVCGGGPPAPAGGHAAADYRAMATSLDEAGRQCNELGVQLCYHPHIDTFVQTVDELNKLAKLTDPDLVGLCIDPAHFVLTGGDPVQVFKDHIDRIKYCHLKDVDSGDVTRLKGKARYEAFAELGTGQVDLRGIMEVLRKHNYSGPLIVELDYSKTSPKESAEVNRKYLADVLGLAPAASAAR